TSSNILKVSRYIPPTLFVLLAITAAISLWCRQRVNRLRGLHSRLTQSWFIAPKLLRGEVGALAHRLELLPDDGRVHLGGVHRLRGEAAIGAGDDVLAPD